MITLILFLIGIILGIFIGMLIDWKYYNTDYTYMNSLEYYQGWNNDK